MFGRFKKKPALHPDYPVVEGSYDMTPDWSITLPLSFNRRFEDGSLVLWRPGITAWIIVWGNDRAETAEARVQALKARRAPQAFAEQEFWQHEVGHYMYRLDEPAKDKRVAAAYAFAFAAAGHVQMSIYFDSEDDLATIEQMWRGPTPKL